MKHYEIKISKLGKNDSIQAFQGTTSTGLNTIVWDLVSERPSDEGTDYRRGTELADPGMYEFSLVIDGQTNKMSFEVREN